jgi:hypothetical protein
MRFSTRWLLIVMAYVALLAATVGTQSRFLVDSVWAVTLLAFCYAVVVAFIVRGKRQAMAIGFVALAATHVICLYLVPIETPAIRFYQALGYTVDPSINLIYEPTDSTLGATSGRITRGSSRYHIVNRLPDLRTSSGVVTLFAGFVGCWIGALAYKPRSSK